jgi:uncharacterized protein
MIKHLLILACALGLSGCNSLSSFLFYPDQHYYQQPENLGLTADRITLNTNDGEQLACWFLHGKGQARGRILFLHGNGENISTHINSVAWLTLEGYEVFLMEYRGYGASTGSPTLANALEDIALAHRWLSERKPDLPLFVFGQSMGGALAIAYTANADKNLAAIDGLISEAAPASWPQIAREVMSRHWLTWIIQLPAIMITSRYDAEDHIGQIPVPVLLIHSTEDPVVPYHHVEQLLEHAPAQTRRIDTTGRHIAGIKDPAVRAALLGFLENP